MFWANIITCLSFGLYLESYQLSCLIDNKQFNTSYTDWKTNSLLDIAESCNIYVDDTPQLYSSLQISSNIFHNILIFPSNIKLVSEFNCKPNCKVTKCFNSLIKTECVDMYLFVNNKYKLTLKSTGDSNNCKLLTNYDTPQILTKFLEIEKTDIILNELSYTDQINLEKELKSIFSSSIHNFKYKIVIIDGITIYTALLMLLLLIIIFVFSIHIIKRRRGFHSVIN